MLTYDKNPHTRGMRPVSLRTTALVLTLIMVLMPMAPFANQGFKSTDSDSESGNEELNEQIIMLSLIHI